jgi:DNA-binding XRE family transcriptional regulator
MRYVTCVKSHGLAHRRLRRLRHVARSRSKAVGDALRRAREQRGESRETVAFHAHMTPGTLARLELGHSDPAWSTVVAVTAALGLTLSELAAAIEARECKRHT